MSKTTRRELFLLGRYLDGANAVTGINVVVGILALHEAFARHVDQSVALVFLAAILDHLDGWLARRFFADHRARRQFGLQFDTLADLLNFDVVPAVMLMTLAPGLASTGVGAALVLFGAVRLAHFNVSTDGGGRNYLGLPTTYAGFAIVNLILLSQAGAFGVPVLLALVAVLALLQVACIPLRLPGTAACVAGLCGVYAATLALCRIVLAP
ncbi:CDP-alcohol phosphatidyltransferase family protein [Roseateles sp. DB2]|uniref:CDP-alcohol phosphatidyltransferase family protein n=1 Tax=Roseateles sp. DB2 TaxID=3453717 RepID=UPI003EE820DC